MFLNKLKASSIHLLLSIILIGIVVGVVLYYWFPNAMIQVSNFKEIALLIIAVDLVLGPLLTFVVYKPKKKSLKFDLSTIATIQITALTYGVFTLYQAHPVYIAFNVDRFTLIRAIDAKPEKAILKEFNISKLSSPKLVVARVPKDLQEKNSLLLSVINGQPDIELRPNLYHPYEDNISEVLAKSLDPSVIFNNKKSKDKLDYFIKKYGKSKNDYAYLPIKGSSKDAIWVLDKISAKPIDIIPVTPWVTISQNKKSVE